MGDLYERNPIRRENRFMYAACILVLLHRFNYLDQHVSIKIRAAQLICDTVSTPDQRVAM